MQQATFINLPMSRRNISFEAQINRSTFRSRNKKYSKYSGPVQHPKPWNDRFSIPETQLKSKYPSLVSKKRIDRRARTSSSDDNRNVIKRYEYSI